MSRHLGLLLILTLAISVRWYWVATHTAVIENEGGEYARLADNLRTGKGYVSILGGPNLMYAPFYPLLIAVVTPLMPSSEVAGRFISLLLGASLTISLYLIARRIHGPKTGLISALIVAIHPLFVGFSAAVYNEITYLAVLFFALSICLKSLENPILGNCILAGVFSGFAYLTRPEAIGFPVLTAVAFLSVGAIHGSLKRMALASAVLLSSFAIVAAPYVVFLSKHTGKLSFEGKSKLNYTIGRRIGSGMSYSQAAWGISTELANEGPLLKSYAYAAYSPYPTDPLSLIRYFIQSAKHNLKELYLQFVSIPSMYGFPLVMFWILGIFGEPWSVDRVIKESFLLLAFAFSLFVVLQAHTLLFRYTLPLFPFVVVWVSKGIQTFSQWVSQTLRSTGSGVTLRIATLVERAAVSLALVLVSAPGFFALQDTFELEQGNPSNIHVKEAGLWIRYDFPGPKVIMTATSTAIPYYAGGLLKAIPYADSETTLRYIESVSPDFVVLEGRVLGSRPVMRHWIEQGIPSERAILLRSWGSRPNERVIVYQWNPSLANQWTSPRSQKPNQILIASQ